MSPLGKKFSKVFVDEFHDILNCHPARTSKWKTLAKQFSKMNVQIALLSATMPPHCLNIFIKPFGIKAKDLAKLRSSTNRPEIGMHVIPVEPIIARQSLSNLVRALNRTLLDEERILVFFSSQSDVEIFAAQHKCANYHSNLWQPGNTKAYNLDLWDRGESKVMACTTAFAQGIDRSNVRYVVIFRPSYGLMVNTQMLGRAGRDGKESHAFYVTDANQITSFRSVKIGREECVIELHDVVHGEECRRYTTTLCMDGKDLAVRCTDKPGCVPCDVCAPDSPMQRFAMEAINVPLVPSPEGSDSNATPAVQASPPAFIPASALHQTMTAVGVSLTAFRVLTLYSLKEQQPAPAPTPTPAPAPATQPTFQDSDGMYDDTSSQITPSQAMILDAMEMIHQPVCRYHAAHSAEADHLLSFIACLQN